MQLNLNPYAKPMRLIVNPYSPNRRHTNVEHSQNKPSEMTSLARGSGLNSLSKRIRERFDAVIECLPTSLGEIITRSLEIPVISIGSGVNCDGQGLVTQDMLGLYKELAPRFLKVYADLQQATISAVTQFRNEVESGSFPTEQNSYRLDDRELDKLLNQN